MEGFGSGPRLAPPEGDVARQAVAALGGYAYQLYASAIAWLGLRDREVLVLEVAEDFAVACRHALLATQAKRTAPDDRLTLQSEGARTAIDSLVDLVQRNPDRTVSFHYLTTSKLGVERSLAHRIDGEPALAYWRRAAAGADVAPLRAILMDLSLKPATLGYLSELSDEQFRRDFLTRIHWQCGAPPLLDVRNTLEAGVIETASTERRLSSQRARAMVPAIVEQVLLKATAIEADDRQLRRADLLTLIDDASRVSVSIEQLLRMYQPGSPALERPSLLTQASDLPFPSPRAARETLVAEIDAHRRADGAVFLTGSTGLGKSLAARLVADASDAGWFIVDFRNLEAADSAARLALLTGEIATNRPAGIIFDDLNEADDPGVRDAFGCVLTALRRCDATAIITAYRAPAPTTLHALGLSAAVPIEIPYLDENEVADLVVQCEGDPKYASRIHRAAARGHPQLCMGVIQQLAHSGWARASLASLLGSESPDEIEGERRAARGRLLAAMPPETSTLLLRTSLVEGAFDRAMVLALGDIAPPIPLPGLLLDRLIGPWIEALPRQRLRVSPLLQGAASEVFGEADCRAIHFCVADRMFEQGAPSIVDMDALTRHAIGGGDDQHARKLAGLVIGCNEETLDVLAPFSGVLQRWNTSRTILPEHPGESVLLRLAQLMALLPFGPTQKVRACWEALQRERDPSSSFSEGAILTKLLLNPHISRHLPEWLELLLRLDQLMSNDGRFAEAHREIENDSPGTPPLAGVMLASQMRSIDTIAKFRALMERLDRETEAVRERCFAGFRPRQADIGVLVNHGWLIESRTPDFDWEHGAADYAACAELAARWDHTLLATRCLIAQAICIDEHGDDQDRALALLLDAEQRFGERAEFARARAKIYWRRQDHSRALPLLTVAADAGDQTPLERTYIAREAAISAAELGDWVAAEGWFERARQAALTVLNPTMQAMAIGLLADTAHAACHGGHPARALTKLREALLALPTIDPDGCLQEAYCHRIIRHAVLWLFNTVTGGKGKTAEGEDIVYQPGSGSNIAPLESIRSHPILPLDHTFYLLVDVDLALAEPTGYLDHFRDDLVGGPILSSETSLGILLARNAICTHDTNDFVARLRETASLSRLVRDQRRPESADAFQEPQRGRVPAAIVDNSAEDDIRVCAEDFLMTFAVRCILAGDTAALDRAIALGLASPEVGALHPLFQRLRGSETRFSSTREGLAVTLDALRSDQRDNPVGLVWAGCWLLLHARDTKWRDLAGPPIIAWIFGTWTQVVRQARFSPVMSMQTVKPVEIILAAPDRSLAAAAGLILAAAPATGAELTSQIKPILAEMAANSLYN